MMVKQTRHHAERATGTPAGAGPPGPGQALIGYPEPESSLFGVPLTSASRFPVLRSTPGPAMGPAMGSTGVPQQANRTGAAVDRESDQSAGPQRGPFPPRPRNSGESPPDPGPRPHRRVQRLLLPLAVTSLGVALGVIIVVMLLAAGVPAPWAAESAVSSGISSSSSTPVEPPAPVRPATRIVEDGRYLVGTQLRAGRYVTEGGVSCHWARLRDQGGRRLVVAEGNGSERTAVRVWKTDAAFQTSGCTPWSRR